MRRRRSGRDHDGFLLGGCSEAAHSSRPCVHVQMSKATTGEEEEGGVGGGRAKCADSYRDIWLAGR